MPLIWGGVGGAVLVVGLLVFLLTRGGDDSSSPPNAVAENVAPSENPAAPVATQPAAMHGQNAAPRENPAAPQPSSPAPSDQRAPANPEPYRFVLGQPTVRRVGLQDFEYEIPFHLEGTAPQGAVSSLKVEGRSGATGETITNSVFGAWNREPKGTLAGTVSMFSQQPMPKYDVEKPWTIRFRLECRKDGVGTTSNEVTAESELKNADAVTVEEFVARYLPQRGERVYKIVTITGTPNFATVGTDGNGYVVFGKVKDQLVDCIFDGPAGVGDVQPGQPITVRGAIADSEPGRLPLVLCRLVTENDQQPADE